ncbi:hypothetical protein BGX34_007218 [Mortierella sp. NVP85]|nr:hypothetical protein BGX34_007218 [Mortierella sp. NVP85]
MPMGTNERNWIQEKVASGLDWKGIKDELRPDEETMQSLEAEKENVPSTLLVKYKDVGSEQYRRNMKERARDTDLVTSVHRWMKEIEEKGGKGWFYDHIDNNPLQYLIAWCTQFQLKFDLLFGLHGGDCEAIEIGALGKQTKQKGQKQARRKGQKHTRQKGQKQTRQKGQKQYPPSVYDPGPRSCTTKRRSSCPYALQRGFIISYQEMVTLAQDRVRVQAIKVHDGLF